MKPHIISTVGMNPLATVVALKRLCQKNRDASGVPDITLLCTPGIKGKGSHEQAARVLSLLSEELTLGTNNSWQVQPCSLDQPDCIRAEVRKVLRRNPNVVLDFTGGRKIMGQWVVNQFWKERVDESDGGNVREPELAYLDVENRKAGASGSATGHAVIDGEGRLVDSSVSDERQTWHLDISRLARLHGYRLSFRHQYGYPETIQECLGNCRHNPPCGHQVRRVQNPRSRPDDQLWTEAERASKRQQYDKSAFQTDGEWLEVVAFRELESALTRIGRTNIHLAWSCQFGREGDYDVFLKRKFELDVVAVLGYQLLVVSCGVGSDAGALKLKAVEALHRSRQIGGSAAHAILLSTCHPEMAAEIEADIRDSYGAEDESFAVWGGWRMLPGLSGRFEDYLNTNMNWRRTA